MKNQTDNFDSKNLLIQHIISSENPIKKRLRGNNFWLIISSNNNNIIVCYHLKTKRNKWFAIRKTEKQLFTNYSCPITYLKETEPIDVDWRDDVFKKNTTTT